MIPPNAMPGTHSIIALDDYTADHTSATFTVEGDSLQAVYVYGTDLGKADDFETLLEGTGMISTTLVSLGEVVSATAEFSRSDLIIVGPDTGDWENSDDVAMVRDSGKPILGLGDGGYDLFGKLHLHIGRSRGAHSSTTSQVRPVDLSHTIYQAPYDGFSSPIPVYNSAVQSVEIYLPSAKSGVLTLGLHATSEGYYPLVQQSGRYFLWGFDGGPEEMSVQGKNLFVNAVWYLLRFRPDVDTLILADFQRMNDIGYSPASVNAVETRIHTLVGMASADSSMTAVVKRLNLDAPPSVLAARLDWDSNENSVAGTNDYVTAIDDYIESLKQGSYPNLQYVIFVGAHEVVPMKARDTDQYEENQWADSLPQLSGYFYSIYHDTSAGATLGHYLTDSIYGDLSYIDNGYGIDNELTPELAIGRRWKLPPRSARCWTTTWRARARSLGAIWPPSLPMTI